MKSTSHQCIAYPMAMELLKARLGATPEELAAWIFLGPDLGGIAAYTNFNELDPPPRFHYQFDMGEDYLAPLMGCWFRETDINQFEPDEHFITGKSLLARWGNLPDPEEYIRSKITNSQLLDIHPIHGRTQGAFREYKEFPPIECGLFPLSYVQSIEKNEFGKTLILDSRPETPEERKLRLKRWYDEECSLRGERGAIKRTAEREGISRQTLSDILNRPSDN